VVVNWPSPAVPGPFDASYYQLSGNIADSGTNPYHGIGACPAGSPLLANTCAGIGFTWARTDGAYLLNLPRNAWRAVGSAFSMGSTRPTLGVPNLLDLSQPPTVATWQRSLDFSADLISVNQQVEDAAPNEGDGNFDDFLDSAQTSVASVQSVVNGSYITTDAHGLDVTSGAAQPLGSLLAAPPPATFPSGSTSFTVGPLASPGETIPIDITFHTPPPEGSQFLKYFSARWRPYPFVDVTVVGRPYTIRVMLKDGGLGDYDGLENGYITDPMAQAAPTSYDVSKLGISVQAGLASVKFSVAFGGVLLPLPSGASLTYKCGGSVRTPLTVSSGSDGSLVAQFPIAAKATCVAQLLIPFMNGAPTIERSASVRTR